MGMSLVSKVVSSAFLKPAGIFGWIVLQYMKRFNRHLEENAVKLCNLQPDHRILEIGFGPGLGLVAAHKIIKAGKGKVYGVDLSPYVIKRARAQFAKELISGRLELHSGNVINLPFLSGKFDRVVHCNCYYYWPNIQTSAKEIYRVMKPGGRMVTTLSLDQLRRDKQRGWKAFAKTDPIFYMTALENSGFVDVHIEYLKHGKLRYQVIYAKKRTRPD